ncbi:hypothetical protein ACHAQH_005895 [Verticillium albo-atrum]
MPYRGQVELKMTYPAQSNREWEAYYSADGQRRQKAFWDRFLKGEANEVDAWEAIEIESRLRLGGMVTQFEDSWPPKGTKLTSMTLGADSRLMVGTAASEGPARHVSFTSHHRDSSVHWDHKFASRTELTGDTSLKLHVQALGSPNVDLYVTVQKLAADGTEVKWFNETQSVEASAMHGWLRASHREKDEAASVSGRPVHAHQRRQWLRRDDAVEVEIEVWPSSTIWEAGDTLRLVVQGHSFLDDEVAMSSRFANSHNFGEVRVWFGGEYDGHLEVLVRQ